MTMALSPSYLEERKSAPTDAQKGSVASAAALRAADRLGLRIGELPGVLGVDPSVIASLRDGSAVLEPGTEPFARALLLVRLFRSLDAIVGEDAVTARAWLRNRNTLLNSAPIDQLTTTSGLENVLAYLDARRAVL